MTIYTLRAIGGQCIDVKNQGETHKFYLKKSEKFELIQQVIAPFSLENPTLKLLHCIKMTFAQLVQINDGSFKLYFRPRGLLGGMMPSKNILLCEDLGINDAEVEDYEIADKLLDLAPINNRFSCISVQTIDHPFPGSSEGKKRTRQIIVQVGDWDWFVNVIKALRSQPIHGMNSNRAVAAILGSEDGIDSTNLVKAFRKNYKFQIYVSYDLKNFYFEPIQSNVTARAEGLLLNCVIT